MGKNVISFSVGIALLFLLSCQEFKQEEVRFINLKKILKGREILENTPKGNLIFITDTLILLSLPKSSDSLYAVYGLESNKYLGSVIRKGKGMQEFSSCLFYGQFQREINGIKIWVTDFNTMEMSLINLTASLKKRATIIEKRISIVNKNLPEPIFLFHTHKNKIAGYHNVVNKKQPLEERFFILNLYDYKPKFKKVPSIPAKNLHYVLHNSLYSSMAKIKPDGSRIVDMRRFQPKINITDHEGNHFMGLILEKTDETNTLGTQTRKGYNKWIDLSDELIYILRMETINGDNKKVISVLDWNGKAINNLSVPEYIQTFAVDERNRIIYGLATREQKLFKYSF